MDRAWIKMDRRSPEYEVGVDMFLDFVSRHANDPNQIRCPCLDCGNVKPGTIKTIKDHLFCIGIINTYDVWYYHGEDVPSSSSTNVKRENYKEDHLWSSLKKDHKDNLYGFADPSSFSHDSGKRDERSFALSVRLEKSKEQQLIFAPYNFGFHWVMVVINPYSDMVYYLDSLNHVDIDHGLKVVIDVALRMFNAQKERNRKNAIWKIIQCPTQPGKVECGYYVMKFMKAIIEDPTILTRSKFNNQSYNQEEIDDVRVEWADLVETLLQDDVE